MGSVFLFCMRALLLCCLDGHQIQFFNFFSCPGCPSQKFQTGFYARVIAKALDWNASAEFLPIVLFYETGQDRFKRDAVQRVFGWFIHDVLFVHKTESFIFPNNCG